MSYPAPVSARTSRCRGSWYRRTATQQLGRKELARKPEICSASVRLTQSTDIPQAVVHGRDASPVLRVAEFSKKHRGRELSKRVAEAKHETTTHEGWRELVSKTATNSQAVWMVRTGHVLASTLEDGSSDHYHTPNGNGKLSANIVGEKRP